MRHIKTLLTLLVFPVIFSSCFEEIENILYTGTEMCTVIDGSNLVSDSGMRFHIAENQGGDIPEETKRIIVNCDVLSSDGKTPETYEIRIISFAPVTVCEPVLRSEADEDELGYDGIGVDSAWLGGGCINAFALITFLEGSTTEHTVNMEFDDIRSNSDTLYFTLRHNAFGESFDNAELNEYDLMTSGQYYSFPFEQFIPSGCDSAVIHLENDWFVTSGSVLTRDRKTFTGNLLYKK